MQTTDIITKITGKKFVVDKRLQEEELSRAQETLNDLENRLRDFINEMDKKKADIVAVCSHGWPINALIALLTKSSVSKKDLGNFPRCGQLTIVENRLVKKLDFN